jgi:hypothetical protein
LVVETGSSTDTNIFYWRAGNDDVDYVLQRRKKVVAIEAKSTARRQSLPGMPRLEPVFAFEREERVPQARENKWGAARRGNGYAGFELELAGAER